MRILNDNRYAHRPSVSLGRALLLAMAGALLGFWRHRRKPCSQSVRLALHQAEMLEEQAAKIRAEVAGL